MPGKEESEGLSAHGVNTAEGIFSTHARRAPSAGRPSASAPSKGELPGDRGCAGLDPVLQLQRAWRCLAGGALGDDGLV